MHDIFSMPGHRIRRLNQVSTAMFREQTQDAGLDMTPVQFAALATIDAKPGLDQATLAQLIAYDKVTIGGVVDRLASKGYVERQPSPSDRRAKAVFLTDEGRALLAQAGPVVDAMQDTLLGPLTRSERDTFMSLMAKLTGL